MVRTDEWRSRDKPLVGARRRRDRGFEADASPTRPYLFKKGYGERDLNPQDTGSRPAMSAFASSPRLVPQGFEPRRGGSRPPMLPLHQGTENKRRGETTPFIAGLWSDYACRARQVSRRIHVRGDQACGVASTNAFLRMWRVIHDDPLLEPGYSVCLASS